MVLRWVLYSLGLVGVGAVAFRVGVTKGREEGTTRVSGALVDGPMLTLPVDGVLRVVTPNDRDWPQALSYHLTLAVRARSLGIS